MIRTRIRLHSIIIALTPFVVLFLSRYCFLFYANSCLLLLLFFSAFFFRLLLFPSISSQDYSLLPLLLSHTSLTSCTPFTSLISLTLTYLYCLCPDPILSLLLLLLSLLLLLHKFLDLCRWLVVEGSSEE